MQRVQVIKRTLMVDCNPQKPLMKNVIKIRGLVKNN